MVEEATIWFIWSLARCYLYILQQPELCEFIGETDVLGQIEAYWDQVSLYQGYTTTKTGFSVEFSAVF